MSSAARHIKPSRHQHDKASSEGGAIGASPETPPRFDSSRFEVSTPTSSRSCSRESSPQSEKSTLSSSSSLLGSPNSNRPRLDSTDSTTTQSDAEKTTIHKFIRPRDVVLVLFICIQLFRFLWDSTPFLYTFLSNNNSAAATTTRGFGRDTTTPTPPATLSIVQTFTFPDIDLRTKYYMGSWYHRNLSAVDVDCKVFRYIDRKFTSSFHDKDVLYTHDALANQVQSNDHWNVGMYLKFYLNILKHSKVPKSSIVAMCVGDSSSTKADLPVAAKTRQAGFMEVSSGDGDGDGDTSKNQTTPYFPIIWPVNMGRHFGPINDYLQLVKASKVAKWEDKKEAIIWRGGFTGVPALMGNKGFRSPYNIYGSRVQAVMANCYQNVSKIDVAFHDVPPKPGVPKALATKLKDDCVRTVHCTMQEQLEYKYILSVEGNDVATGLKWQLASNSVVFMAKPRTASFAMEDQLVPFYHYIPVNDNYTNLEEMVEWAIQHDEKAKKIAEQSTQYMNDLWISKKAQQEYEQIQTNLAFKYQQQFASGLWSCLPEERRKEVTMRR